MVDSEKPALSVEESQLNALRHIGLTEYESRLYLVMVKMGPVKASELSFRAQIPRTKAYGAINELERKGLLRIIPGKPDVYSPASPGEVLMPIVNKLSRQLTEAESVVESLMLTFESNRFVKREGPKEADGFWEVEGRPGVINKLNQIFSDASKSINYCTSATGLVRAYKAHCDILEKASDRGVAVRLIAPVNSENAGVAREIAEVLEFKSLDKPFGQNFVTVDSRELIVMETMPEDLRTDQGADKGVWTTNRLVVELHGELFERLWNATPTRKLPPQTA
jgi:sugar-specific transcriptional regulator TrmB